MLPERWERTGTDFPSFRRSAPVNLPPMRAGRHGEEARSLPDQELPRRSTRAVPVVGARGCPGTGLVSEWIIHIFKEESV